MFDRYKKNLLKVASSFDAITEACGEITNLAISIIDEKNDTAVIVLMNRISSILDEKKESANLHKIAKELHDSLLKYYGYSKLQETLASEQVEEDSRTLEELLIELNNLIGLETVKNKVNDLINYQKVQKLRKDNNLNSERNTLHLAFTGNPGTGKTTVARIVGRIYKQIGLLSKGHFVEVSRTDLIAGYQGQTALKVKKVIEKAKGGVLFIDEAYSITENDHSDSYGRECLTELTKALEDYRDDLVVIVAGYTEPMNKFFDSNPGLKSRFNTFIEFDDYNVEELEMILDCMCKKNEYILDEEAKIQINQFLQENVLNKTENFSNGRLVRNLFDDLVMNHARRISKKKSVTREDLMRITKDDV